MHDSDWLKLNLRLIFLICVQMQILCNGATNTHTPHKRQTTHIHTIHKPTFIYIQLQMHNVYMYIYSDTHIHAHTPPTHTYIH